MADVRKKEIDSDSDSSSDSDDEQNSNGSSDGMDIDEEEAIKKLAGIQFQLTTNPYLYDLHVEKVGLLKSLGDLDQLRLAREKFSELYPLTETLWLSWIRDEKKLIEDGNKEDRDRIIALFKRAENDYLSVNVWNENCLFMLTNLEDEEGIEQARKTFEEALSVCALHMPQGGLIWDLYREFEASMLGMMRNEEDLKEQEKRYMTLFRRQLSVPLLNMEKTYTAYNDVKEKLSLPTDDLLEREYAKALEKLHAVEIHEKKLLNTGFDNLRLCIYDEYIDAEIKNKAHPSRIQCLFERAIAESPLTDSLWKKYLEYLSKNVNIESVVMSACKRAVRNLSWEFPLWMTYFGKAEEYYEDKDAVKAVFEEGLIYFTDESEILQFWLRYLEFIRRKMDFAKLNNQDVDLIMKTFDAAENHALQIGIEDPSELLLQILLFKGRMMYRLEKPIAETREHWNSVLLRGYGENFIVWNEFLTLEQKFSDGKSVRKQFVRAMTNIKDHPDLIAKLWIDFERDYGTYETIESARSKIKTEIEKREVEGTNYSSGNNAHGRPKKFATKRKFGGGDEDGGSYEEKKPKGKSFEKFKREESNSKKSKKAGTPEKMDEDFCFKVPNVPSKSEPDDAISRELKKVVKDVKNPEEVKHNTGDYDKTVFTSNLSYEVTERELLIFFKTIGTVEEIRLVRNIAGKSKGFAYVRMSSQEEAKKAISQDRSLIMNRPAYIAKCDPDRNTREPEFKYTVGKEEKNKLFIKGIPFSMTGDDIRNVFEPFGEIKDVRLVTLRNGHSKGIAYVDYKSEVAASLAILKTDGMELEGKKISVALSNPPVKGNTPFSYKREESKGIGERKPRAIFVPRALQVQKK